MMTKKEYIIFGYVCLIALVGWLMWFEMFLEAVIHPNVYIISWNLSNRLNIIYVFVITSVLFISSIACFYYMWKWAGIEKELKEEMKYCGVKTLGQLKRYKKEKEIIN